jgi:hypothetical protein
MMQRPGMQLPSSLVGSIIDLPSGPASWYSARPNKTSLFSAVVHIVEGLLWYRSQYVRCRVREYMLRSKYRESWC